MNMRDFRSVSFTVPFEYYFKVELCVRFDFSIRLNKIPLLFNFYLKQEIVANAYVLSHASKQTCSH